MRRLVFALLFGLALVPVSVQAQSGSVAFEVCNVGTIDIDVFFMQKIAPTETKVRPATCQTVARNSGSMEPATVGIAFADATGTWGAARRFDHIPDLGLTRNMPLGARVVQYATTGKDAAAVEVLSAASGTRAVRHGNATVTLPMQLLFQPRIPECKQSGTGNSRTERSGGRTTTIIEVQNICEDLGYTLKVEAHPESREASLGAQPVAGAMSTTSGMVDPSGKVPVDWAREAADRQERNAPAAVSWRDLIAGLQQKRRRDDDVRRGRKPEGPELTMPEYLALRGTVARVEIDEQPLDANRMMPVVQIYFRESPDDVAGPGGQAHSEFNVCTERLDVLQDVFGPNYRTGMVGRAVEVRGSLGRRFFGGSCSGRSGSMALVLAREISTVSSAQFPAGRRAWTAPATPGAQPPPVLTASQTEEQLRLRASTVVGEVRRVAGSRLSKACVDQMEGAKSANSIEYANNLYRYQQCQKAVIPESEKESQRGFECARNFILADPASDTRDREAFLQRVVACAQAGAPAAAAATPAAPAPAPASGAPTRPGITPAPALGR